MSAPAQINPENWPGATAHGPERRCPKTYAAVFYAASHIKNANVRAPGAVLKNGKNLEAAGYTIRVEAKNYDPCTLSS